MKKQKIYVGSGKKAAEYDIVNITLSLNDLPEQHIYEFKGKKYINLTVAAKKKTDEYGKTHYVAVNEWKPENKEQENNNEQNNDLPF